MSNVHGDPYFDDPTGSEQLQTIETCSESSLLCSEAGQSGIGGGGRVTSGKEIENEFVGEKGNRRKGKIRKLFNKN